MAMAGRMDTHTDLDILTLAQWLSPAYPVGGFAYSHGLEAAIEGGSVRDATAVRGWIADVLRHGTGWNDAVFLVAAFHAADAKGLIDIDLEARAFCASAERAKETDLLGQAFATVTADVWGLDLPRLSYPVCVGHAARLQGLPLRLTTQMFLQAFASNLVGCATRLVPLGQTEAQRMIRDLTPLCADVADRAQGAGLDQLGATTFLADIAAMKHETQYARIFRT